MLRERPDAVIVWANPRYASFWAILAAARALGTGGYAHGHGLYKRRRVGLLTRVAFRCLLSLATKYICYAPIVRDRFVELGFPATKLAVAHNSLVNEFVVTPGEKTGAETGILFLGRLRPGSNVRLLIRAVEHLRRHNSRDWLVHVVGDGEERAELEALSADKPWVHAHGEIYSQTHIQEISRQCLLGCHPGSAGLSVVHMMSLSLPPVAHGRTATSRGTRVPSRVISGTAAMGGSLTPREARRRSMTCSGSSLNRRPTWPGRRWRRLRNISGW
jgi:glycosyltransferase involved in cell wall biosynthesis